MNTILRHELAIMSVVGALFGLGMAGSGMVQISHYEHSAKVTAHGWRKVCAHENKVVVCKEVRR